MDIEKIKQIMNRIPYIPILVIYLIIIGYQTYLFFNSSTSPLQIKRDEIVKEEVKVRDVEKQLKDAKDFIQSLQAKKESLIKLTTQLNEKRATLSEELDIPAFIKMIVTEAKKVGLSVTSIQPKGEKIRELYSEQLFDMNFRGVFVQLLVFLQRISSAQKIIRTEDISLKPFNSPAGKYAEVEGKLILQTYRYTGGKGVVLDKSANPAKVISK